MATLRKPVVMVGMMGAGKTAVGRELASRLMVPFTDSDAEIESAANRSVTEIFERDGETFFRDKEAQIIARLLEGPPLILAVGGGAFLRPQTRRLIADKGVSLWIRADLDLLWSRVRRRDHRPLLRTADPYGTLAALAAAREPVYALADLSVQASPDASIEQTAQAAQTCLASRSDVLS